MGKEKSDEPASEVLPENDATAQLAKMGYKSELPRNLGMLSVLGL